MRFGVRGRSPGQLQRPTGVTVDMNGDIIVADYDNRWISIFSSDGKFKVDGLSQEKNKTFFNTAGVQFADQIFSLPVTEQNWGWKTDGPKRCGCG